MRRTVPALALALMGSLLQPPPRRRTGVQPPPSGLMDFLTERRGQVRHVLVYGVSAAVREATVQRLDAALR